MDDHVQGRTGLPMFGLASAGTDNFMEWRISKSFQKTIQNRKTVNNVSKSPGRQGLQFPDRLWRIQIERNATVSRPRQTLLNSNDAPNSHSFTMKILYLKTRNIWINAAMAYPLNRTAVLKFRIIIIITKSSKPPRLSSEQFASEEVKA